MHVSILPHCHSSAHSEQLPDTESADDVQKHKLECFYFCDTRVLFHASDMLMAAEFVYCLKK